MILESPTAGACPALETLLLFSAGKLSPAAQHLVAEHFESCTECLAKVESNDVDEPDALVQEIRRCAAVATHFGQLEAPALKLGGLFGPYHLLDLLGQGGMGIVYRARQLSLNRDVALKVVRAGSHAGPDATVRLRREGEAIARLQHPNIVEVYDCGELHGQPYLAMELVEGPTLAALLSAGALPFREAALIVKTLAAAMHYAHEHGVLHRDLKPANVLTTPENVLKITDFGLAKLLDLDDGHTQSNAILGTPAYMAPEQAAGAGPLEPTADIHALGVILYEALTGQVPFKGANAAHTRELVRSAEPVAPAQLRAGVPGELAAICLKCLEKSPRQRYASAAALADDLDAWLNGRNPLGLGHRILQRGRRLARRRAVWLGASTLALVAVLLTLQPGAPVPQQNVTDDPEQLRLLDEQLDRRGQAELLGVGQLPAWYQLRTGADATQVSLDADGLFSVYSWSTCLVELLPDPRHDDYLIQAELLHKEGTREGGEIGIYCERVARTEPASGCEAHLFLCLAFNDVWSVKSRRPEMAQKPGMDGVHLLPRLYGKVNETWAWDFRMPGPPALEFVPAGWAKPTWRSVQIRVTPAHIEAAWNGQPFGKYTTAQLNDAVSNGYRATQDMKGPAPAAFPLALAQRGGFGLYVRRGSAAFRNVSIVHCPQN